MTSASGGPLDERPYTGVRVVDLSTRLSGAFAARLFGDCGAEVTLVEPPTGHPLRHEPPFLDGRPGDDRSVVHAYANWNKRSVIAETAAERDDLLATADVVVTGDQPAALPDGVLELSITAHGSTGPLADVPGNDLTACARTGWAMMNAYVDEPPLQLPVRVSGYLAGVVGFLGAAAALRSRRSATPTERVEVSELDVMELTCGPWALASVFRGVDTGNGPMGVRTRDRAGPLYRSADGQICLGFGDWKSWSDAMTLLGLDEFADDPRLVPAFGRHQQDLKPVAARAVETVATMECWPLFHQLSAMRCISGCVHDMAGLLGDEQLAARGFWGETAITGRPVRAPGLPAVTTPRLWALDTPAPALSDHDRQSRSHEQIRNTPGPPRTPAGSPLAPPLAGVRVLAFTQAWSGTLGTQLLAMLGADVVQIELLNKSDVWRNTSGGVPDGVLDPGRRQIPQNTQGLYNSVNLNKRGVALDLTSERGRELFWAMVPRFDVVAENFAPHVMPKWGVTLETLAAQRPDIVFASISGYGAQGPYRRYPANGSTIEPMSGLSSLHGYPDDPATNTGGLLPDPAAAFFFAATVVSALHQRDRTGRPQRVDVSMMESVAATVGDAVLELGATGVERARTGNHHPRIAPHGFFPVADGGWLALATETEQAWEVVADKAGLGSDPRFVTMADRKRNETELEALLAAWTRAQNGPELAEALGRAGVTAAMAVRGTDVFTVPDAQMTARGFLQEVEHPETGVNLVIGAPWVFSARPAEPLRPAPGVGEHSRQVLCAEVGLSHDEYDRLVADGVTGTL